MGIITMDTDIPGCIVHTMSSSVPFWLPSQWRCYGGRRMLLIAAKPWSGGSLFSLTITVVEIRYGDLTLQSLGVVTVVIILVDYSRGSRYRSFSIQIMMLKALRERFKSERAKDGDPKKSEEVASSAASATSPRSVPGTSMRGGDISQPAQTSHALASVESRPHDKVTSSTAQSAFSVQEPPATKVSTVPPPPRIVPFPPTASRAQAATSATIVSTAPNRPEQLWDLALRRPQSRRACIGRGVRDDLVS